MNRRNAVAAAVAVLLLVSSSTLFVLDYRRADTGGPEEALASADFGFDSVERSDGGRFFVFEKTILSSELGLDVLFEECGEYARIYATATADEDRRSVSIDVHIYSGGKEVMSFSDTVSEEEFDSESAYFYGGVFASPSPEFVPVGNATVDAVKNINGNVKYLKSVVDKISSSVLKEKIKKALANEIVKKVLKAVALSAIPFIGWATAVIRVGLLAYDIVEFAKLLQELRDEADRDLSAPHVLWSDGTNMRYRLPVNGYGGLELDLAYVSGVNFSEKKVGEYYFAYMENKKIFISTLNLSKDLAVKIALNPGPEPKEMNIYTLLKSSATALYASSGYINHETTHDSYPGFYHIHHALHNGNSYPAHAFYGEPIYFPE